MKDANAPSKNKNRIKAQSFIFNPTKPQISNRDGYLCIKLGKQGDEFYEGATKTKQIIYKKYSTAVTF